MRQFTKAVVIGAAAISLLIGAAGCKQPSFGNQLSTKQEVEIGRQASAEVESQFPVSADPSVTRPVNDIAAKVIPVVKQLRGDIDYHVRVLKSDEEDSFSLPGGWIYIDQGLITKLGGDNDMLACVIAHEAAHVALHHPARQLSDAYGTDSLIDLLTEGNYQEASNISLQLALLSHTHQDEIDADRLGIKIAMKAGYAPEAMQKFLILMEVQPPAEDAWVETHPLPKSRFTALDLDIKDLHAGKY